MRRSALLTLIVLLGLIASSAAWAGFTETLPKGVFLLETFYIQSYLENAYDNDGEKGPLLDEIEQYEPGGSLQGVLIPKATALLRILVTQIQFGITDTLTFGVGVPVVLGTHVEPNLEWEEGDYQWVMGRAYSESDFWQWAESMGQPKPQTWEGNEGVLSDIILASRWRFTDRFSWFRKRDMAMAAFVFGAIPTGRQADPEEIVASGTTSWDLHSQGELGFHLSMDKFFKKSLDDRLTLGLDLYYEFLFAHRYETPDGDKNPLLLTYSPYVGEHYTLDPGDFTGFSFQTDVVPWRGPALRTWLVKKDPSKAKDFPPIVKLSFRYTFTYLFQSDWESNSETWDWEREKLWRPGYKNILLGKLTLSLLRLGVPLMPYVAYRNLSWIPGKNCRAPDVFMIGVQLPLKFAAGM